MLLTRPPQDLLSPFTFSLFPNPNPNKPTRLTSTPLRKAPTLPFLSLPSRRLPPPASSTFVEQLEGSTESESFEFDASFDSPELKRQGKSLPLLEVRELDELPEQWRRTKLAWLCKELPAHKASTLVRILNAQRKWIRQEDATYVAVHCMRIRENETGFKVLFSNLGLHYLFCFPRLC